METQDQVEEVVDNAAPHKEDVVVDRDTKKLVHDLHKYKSQVTEFEQKLQRLEQEKKQAEVERMKSNEEWKKLAEIREHEAKEAQQKYQSMSQSVAFDKKYSAVREAALKAGIRKEALDDLELLDLSTVELETTSTGRVNVLGADDCVDRLKVTRPHWFGKRSAHLNSETPDTVAGQGVTYSDVLKAEKKAKETGDSAPYQKIVLQYKKQLTGG